MADDILRREFPAVLEPTGDGRTLELRIVPHGKTARVSDDGGRTFYEEEWVRGVFRNKENSPKRVLVNIEHERGFGGVVGRGTGFTDSDEGFDGEFRVLNGPDGDKALELVNEGAFTGVSVEAIPMRSERTEGGVVRRISAKLLNVSLCRNPAFPDARVLAVREAPPEPVPEPEEPQPEPAPEPDPEPAVANHVDETLARIGYEPLVTRAVVDRPWDGSASRFDDDQYQRSALVCRPGDGPPKTRCSLPVLEPDGSLNVNGMHAAAARLNQTGLSPQLKAQAARKLIRYYRQAGEEPPPMLSAMAGR